MSNDNIEKGLETLQNKLGAHEFEFDDQMWDKMEVKLDADNTFFSYWKQKLAVLLFLAPVRLSALLLLVAGGICFSTNSGTKIADFSSNAIHSPLTTQEPITNEETITTLAETQINTKKGSTNTANQKNTSVVTTENTVKNKSNNKINQVADKNKKETISTPKKITTPQKEPIAVIKNHTSILSKEKKNTGVSVYVNASIHDKITSSDADENSIVISSLLTQNIPSLLISKLTIPRNALSPKKPIYIFPKKNKNHFGITAGYLANSNSPKMHIYDNNFIGVFFTRKLNSKWSFGLTLSVKNTKLSKSISYTYDNVLFSPVGRSTLHVNKEFSKFRTFESVISLQYALPQLKSSFILGIRPSYITKDTQEKSSYTEDNYGYRHPNKTTVTAKNIFDTPFYGIRRFNIGFTFGYQYQINRRWSVGIDYTKGLIDISKNGVLLDKTFHKNTDLQLGLSYWLR